MKESVVNAEASKKRHSVINFETGIYQKNRRLFYQKSFKFLKRILSLAFLFFVLYTWSYTYQGVYSETLNKPLIKENIQKDNVYVLGQDGFVLKPLIQTEKGDRSRAHQIIIHQVKSGDTILGIARKYKIKTKTILDNNSDLSLYKPLKIGQEIKILPVDGLALKIDSLSDLDKKIKTYKVKLEDILRQNELEDKKEAVGKELIFPGAEKVEVKRINHLGSQSLYTGEISNNYIWPANGKITQYFHRYHYALDIANRNKGPILAIANGVVTKASYGWNGGYGNVIIIDHGNGLKTLYAHNQKLYVKVGDKVKQGETISWMGNTGRVFGVTGIHLHFEVIYKGLKKNPLSYIGYK
jgi:murein DD-endopeptidase MepM/ murein hydrolase activator NlpD